MGTVKERRGFKYFKTASLTAAFFVLGLCLALIGPTLPTLAYNLGVEESSLSFIFTARGCGYLVGSILSALLFKIINQHLVIAINLTLTALGNYAAPFMPNSILLATVLLLAGCSMGVLDTGGNVLCLKLWGSESEPWMQTLHFFFAFGATLSPILARPFINEAPLSGNGTNTEIEISVQNVSAATTEETVLQSDSFPYVAWAFIGAASSSVVVSVVFYFLTCLKNAETDSCQEDTVKQEGPKFRVQILVLLFIFFFLYVGTEVTFGLFVYSFAIGCENHYSKHAGALMNSLFWGTFAGGRFFAIFFSHCISPKSMLILDLIGTAVSTVAMSLFPYYASTSEWILWASIALYGWSMASLFPTGITWAERYITVTGRAASILVVGASLGEMALPFVMGHLMPHDVMNLMYFCVMSTGLSIFNFLILNQVASARGSRHKRSRKTLKLDASGEKMDEPVPEEYALLSTSESTKQEGKSGTSSDEI